MSMVFVFALALTAFPLLENSDAGQERISVETSTRALPIDAWPNFHGDAARTGNTTAMGPGSYNLQNTLAVGCWWSSPVVAYDKIFMTYNGGIRCYNASSASLVWSSTTPGAVQYASPMVYGNNVFVSNNAADLYCYLANSTGTPAAQWTFTATGNAAGSPTTDGRRVFYSTYTTVYAVWMTNGSLAWSGSLGSTSVESSPSYCNGRVYCGAGDSYGGGVAGLRCFNATNGASIWSYSSTGVVCGTPAVEYGRVYFGSIDNKVYCLDAGGSGPSTTKYWDYAFTTDVVSSAALGYGRVYIGTESATNNLHCLDAFGSGGTTTKYWSQTLTPAGSFGVTGSPAITSDYIFVGTTGNVMHCRDRGTGASVWMSGTPPGTAYPGSTYGMSSAPAVYKNRLAVASDNGNLYLIGPLIDLIPPMVQSTNPSNGVTEVPVENNVSVRFSEVVYRSNLTTTTLALKDSLNQAVAGYISADLSIQTAFFNPSSPLKRGETYTLYVSTDITDWSYNHLDGNGNGIFEGPLSDGYQMSFTTVPPKPPVIGSIPTLHPMEDVPYMLNLTTVISDPDTPKDQLVLTENSPYATLSGYELNMLYPELVTSDLINLSVSDGIFTVHRNIDVVVTTVNDPSVIAPVPTLMLTEDISFELDLADYIYDNDTASYELVITDNSTYTKIDKLHINFTYPNGVTYDLDNVTLNDRGVKIYASIEVRVTPVNDPPTIAALPQVEVVEDEVYNKSLNSYIADIDTPEPLLRITCSSPYVTVAGHFIELLYPDGIYSDTINVTVSDGQLNASATMDVVTTPTNDPPFWNGDPAINATEDVYGEFDLSPFINDTDTLLKDITLSSDSKYGKISGKKFQFTYLDGVLVEYVTFTIFDGEFYAKAKGNVTVTPVNDAPVLSKSSVSPTKGNTTTKFTFSVTCSDIDSAKDPDVKLVIGGKEHVCAKSSGNLKTGAVFKCETNLTAGEHAFYFIADDKDGGSASTKNQTVSVKKEAPVVVADDDDTEPSSGLSGMAIGIIVLIAIVVLLAIAAVVVLMVVRRKKKDAPQQAPAQPQAQQPATVQAGPMYPSGPSYAPGPAYYAQGPQYQPAAAQPMAAPLQQPAVAGPAQSWQLGSQQQYALPPYDQQQAGSATVNGQPPQGGQNVY